MKSAADAPEWEDSTKAKYKVEIDLWPPSEERTVDAHDGAQEICQAIEYAYTKLSDVRRASTGENASAFWKAMGAAQIFAEMKPAPGSSGFSKELFAQGCVAAIQKGGRLTIADSLPLDQAKQVKSSLLCIGEWPPWNRKNAKKAWHGFKWETVFAVAPSRGNKCEEEGTCDYGPVIELSGATETSWSRRAGKAPAAERSCVR